MVYCLCLYFGTQLSTIHKNWCSQDVPNANLTTFYPAIHILFSSTMLS